MTITLACALIAVWVLLILAVVYFSAKFGYDLCEYRMEDELMTLEREKEILRRNKNV